MELKLQLLRFIRDELRLIIVPYGIDISVIFGNVQTVAHHMKLFIFVWKNACRCAVVYRVHQCVGPGGERAVRAGSSGEPSAAEVVAEAALGYYPGLSRQGLVPQPYQPAHRLPSLFFYVSCYGHVKKKLRLLIILFNFVILRIKLWNSLNISLMIGMNYLALVRIVQRASFSIWIIFHASLFPKAFLKISYQGNPVIGRQFPIRKEIPYIRLNSSSLFIYPS